MPEIPSIHHASRFTSRLANDGITHHTPIPHDPSRHSSATRLTPAYPSHEEKEQVHITAHALAFLGVAFFGVAFFADVFFVAAAFRVGLAAAAGCVDLVTRPDLVLPRTTAGLSSTAGAAAAVLRGRPALAFGFAVSAFFLGEALEAVAFFAGAAFLGAALVDADFC